MKPSQLQHVRIDSLRNASLRWGALAILVLTALTLFAVPASAKGAIHVSGSSRVPVDGECTAPPAGFEEFVDFTMVIQGDLQGCWYTSIAWGHQAPNGRYTEAGREVFVGTINGTAGSFSTVYIFSALYDADGNELSGGCIHPIVRGYGGLSSASGVITFRDVIGDPNKIANMSGVVRY